MEWNKLEKRKTKRTDQRMWGEKDAIISQNDKRIIMITRMINGLDWRCFRE